MTDTTTSLRRLPSIDLILRNETAEGLSRVYPRERVVEALREVMAEARSSIRRGLETPRLPDLVERARKKLEHAFDPTLRPVINATGVILHTNLGRAPLSAEAIRAIESVAAGYSNLEFRLESGDRGSRHEHLSDLLRRLTGAEDAIAVNNNASAVMMVLSAFAQGRQVIVSRGQAVEIGGGFRIPDVLLQSGAKLVEVGTTNRTYLSDYERSVGPETALLLHVHPSNFRVEGFTHSATIEELVDLGRRAGIPVVDDLGSGTLVDTARYGLQHEPMVQERIAAGVDLVCFSGDKLLGGPQAGIVAGKAAAIETLRRHPLARAIRVDKMAIAGLVATLRHYALGEEVEKVPIWRMIALTAAEVAVRANRMCHSLRKAGLAAETMAGLSTVGGGSLPGETLPTRLVAVSADPGGPSAMEIATRLRTTNPPVVARLERDLLLLDLRTVAQPDDRLVLKQILAAARP